MKLARYNFPDLVTPVLSYNDTITVLKNKSILSEGIGGVVTKGKTPDWHAIFKENITEAERTIMAKLRDLSKKYAKEKNDSPSKEQIEKIYQDLKKQFNKGVNVEKEHKSADPKLITLDHLSEDPKYYDKLEKVEAKEATSSSSSGSYETPSFLAKSMSPKKWRGRSKTQIPGGKFVEVKKKCKKFPYCNQGDINALTLTENSKIKNIIKKLAKEFGVNESIIKKIIIREYSKN
jgi:hypothetical protein